MNKKVLIIDDDNRNIFALKAVLKSRHFQVISANSMQEAFELLAANGDTAVILMDIMMPLMDGYEAIPKIKADERYKNIKIVAVTAQAMAGDKEKCLAAGADDYISKPIDVDKLLKAIRQIK